MIKVYCINDVYYSSKESLIKGNIYLTRYDYFSESDKVYIPIFTEKNVFIAAYLKTHFISLHELRNQQINKILKND